MREAGLQGAYLRRKWRAGSTRANPAATPAPDLVNRDFTAPGPDRLWVADATRIPCGQGAFWLAAVRDAFSNRIVGWRCSDRCDTDLVLGALEYAIWTRNIGGGQVIHHSDRGSTYTSFRFSQRLDDHGILASTGWVGDSYDNALMENFFSTLKTELVYRRTWRTREEAENALFAYIDGWYNTERIQARLGWRSPDEYETAWHASQTELDDHPAATLSDRTRLPPGSWPSELSGEAHPGVPRLLDRGLPNPQGQVELARIDGKITELPPTQLPHQPVVTRLVPRARCTCGPAAVSTGGRT